MAINVYTGLMGSGKSYECVSSVIIPAIRQGRRVVTNVDGIDGEAIRAYCVTKFNLNLQDLGHVIHCLNEQVHRADFLPHGGGNEDTFCHAGDLICIDEAWRFWGADCKIIGEHRIFFREHRHYVDAEKNISCDLVVMVQDISDLNRILKVVIELSFRTSKLKSLGFSKVYRVDMWQGYKQTIKGRVSSETKKYNPEIFPLYSSYVGGKGKEVVVDDRQNIFKQKKTWIIISLLLLGGAYFANSAAGLFGLKKTDESVKADSGFVQPSPKSSISQPTKSTAKASMVLPSLSDEWRLVGMLMVSGEQMIVLTNASGVTRLEHPSSFQGSGVLLVGDVDGKRVTTWSGSRAGKVQPQ